MQPEMRGRRGQEVEASQRIWLEKGRDFVSTEERGAYWTRGDTLQNVMTPSENKEWQYVQRFQGLS